MYQNKCNNSNGSTNNAGNIHADTRSSAVIRGKSGV
jgi:hypothetical protein